MGYLSTTLYDRNGNMTSSTNYHTQDRVRYEYDENGNTKTVTDKDGLKTYYTYDNNDNEVLKTTGNIKTNKRYDTENKLTDARVERIDNMIKSREVFA